MAKVETQAAGASEGGRRSVAASAKIVFVGFMAAGKSTRRQASRRASRDGGAGQRRAARGGARRADRRLLRPRTASRPSASARRRSCWSCSIRRTGRGGRSRSAAGQSRARAVREELRRHLCVYVEVDPALAWKRSRGLGAPACAGSGALLRPACQSARRFTSPSRAPLFDPPRRQSPRARARTLWSERSTRRSRPPCGSASRLSLLRAHALGGDAAGRLPGLRRAGRARRRRLALAERSAPVRGGRRARRRRLHGRRLAAALGAAVAAGASVTVPAGEQHKTLAEAERVLRALAQAGMERSDAILAFGGGVVGDLAGFCAPPSTSAACDVVQVPTTVVAQVDCRLRRQDGVDLPEAKNYAGAFHQPAAVLTDPSLLSTLAERGAPGRFRGGAQDCVDRRRAALERRPGAPAVHRGRRRPARAARGSDRGLHEDEARGRGGGRARHGVRAPVSTSATLSPTRSRRPPATPVTPRRGGGRRPAGRAAPVGARGSASTPRCGEEVAEILARNGLSGDVRRPLHRRDPRARGARQEAARRSAEPRAAARPR